MEKHSAYLKNFSYLCTEIQKKNPMPVSEVLKVLDAAGAKASANADTARAFLIRAGIVDAKTGQLAKQYQ